MAMLYIPERQKWQSYDDKYWNLVTDEDIKREAKKFALFRKAKVHSATNIISDKKKILEADLKKLHSKHGISSYLSLHKSKKSP